MGKSCLLLRFSDGSFTTSFITTIGFVFLVTMEFMSRNVLAYLCHAKMDVKMIIGVNDGRAS